MPPIVIALAGTVPATRRKLWGRSYLVLMGGLASTYSGFTVAYVTAVTAFACDAADRAASSAAA